MCARRPAKVHPSTWSSQRSGKRFMSKGSILVVDDESEIREGLELLLRGEGYGVSSAETGESGLEKLEQRSEEHTSELQSRVDLVCRLLLEKKKNKRIEHETMRINIDDRSQHVSDKKRDQACQAVEERKDNLCNPLKGQKLTRRKSRADGYS